MGGGGKKGGASGTPEVSPYEYLQAQLATDWYKNTSPTRAKILGQATNWLQNGFNAQSLPAFKPLFNAYNSAYSQGRSALENQYNQAQQQAMDTLPTGGALASALNQNRLARADSVGNLTANMKNNLAGLQSDIAQNLWNSINGWAMTAPGQTMNAFGNAGNSWAQRYNAQLAANSQPNGYMGALGGAIGSLIGGNNLFGGNKAGGSGGGIATPYYNTTAYYGGYQ